MIKIILLKDLKHTKNPNFFEKPKIFKKTRKLNNILAFSNFLFPDIFQRYHPFPLLNFYRRAFIKKLVTQGNWPGHIFRALFFPLPPSGLMIVPLVLELLIALFFRY